MSSPSSEPTPLQNPVATAEPLKAKKPWFKKWWVWVIAAIVLIAGISSLANGKRSIDNSGQSAITSPLTSSTVPSSEPSAESAPSVEPSKPSEPDVPAEYKSALKKAESYSRTLHMSKAGIYDQLTSEYGEKFTPEAAQYAVDNVDADWNANALAKAKTYQDTMSMSPAAIWDQLVSEYGEKFTKDEADYAIAHLND